MIRIIFIILLIFSALFVGAWLTVPFAFIYAMRWQALELLPLALLVDSYFATISGWPLFTAFAFLIILIAELAKRHLQFT